jgi:hypothetical protein
MATMAYVLLIAEAVFFIVLDLRDFPKNCWPKFKAIA